MPACKPARQCTLIKPYGNRCGAMALRGKRFCYHHNGNHQKVTRDRLLVQRLDCLTEKMNAMDAAALLNFLHHQLSGLTQTLIRFPIVAHTVVYTIERIGEITSLESAIRTFLSQYQEHVASLQAAPIETSNLPETSPESNI